MTVGPDDVAAIRAEYGIKADNHDRLCEVSADINRALLALEESWRYIAQLEAELDRR